MHKTLIQEWTERPPDVSYRFVVSPDTLRTAQAIGALYSRKQRSVWQRALAPLGRVLLFLLAMVLIGWLSSQAGNLVAAITFLVFFLAFAAGLRRLARLPVRRLYDEYFSNNEFLVEGRISHLWFDERSLGAIRRWSTFEQVVEFEEGMWLFLRRGDTFGQLRGILISKESLPNSCSWSELQVYLQQRIADAQDAKEA